MSANHARQKNMLRSMCLIREFEGAALELHRRALIPEGLHSSTGQEAIAVAIAEALEPGDYVGSTHRPHAHCIARGLDIRQMLAELAGREGGYGKGRGGSMNLASREQSFLGANNVVAAGVGQAAGAALASAYLKNGNVALGITGEAGSSQGLFHETLNLSALWRLPLVVVVENNQYAVSTHVSIQVAGGNIAARAAGYGIPGETVDGNDPDAILSVLDEAVKRARRGDGPTLIEANTYRLDGHWSGDWGGYRSEDDVAAAMKRDPIKTYGERLTSNGILNQSELEQFWIEAKAHVGTAVDFVLESAPAPMADALTDVYGTDWVGIGYRG
jgi:pyruvate dehydrogenase E1 component alpha subunit